MTAAALLDELDNAGGRVVREGDNLRVRAAPGATLDLHTPRIKDARPAILAALRLRERIVAAATAATAAFDRAEYDRLWAEWDALQEEAL